MNDYYTFTPPLVAGSKARAGEVNNQFTAIEAAFDMLPADPDSIELGRSTVGIDSGSGNSYVITTENDLGAPVEGEEIVFKATHTNTGAATLNRDAAGAVALRRFNGDALSAADVVTGRYYAARYDAVNTQWRIVWPAQVTTISGALTYAAPTSDVDISAATEGAAVTVLRSDAKLRLSQSIAPTWTGIHTFSNTVNFDGAVDFDGAAVFDSTVDINGVLTVDGVSTFSTTANFDGTVDFDGAVVFDSTVDINGTTTIDGVTTFSNTVNFDGSADFDGAVVFDNVSDFNAAATFDSTADFNGAVTFDSTAAHTGAITSTVNSSVSGSVAALSILGSTVGALEIGSSGAAANTGKWHARVATTGRLSLNAVSDDRTTVAEAIGFSRSTTTPNGMEVSVAADFNSTVNVDGVLTNTVAGSGANSGIQISSTQPSFSWNETGGGTNAKRWDMRASSETLTLRTVNDASNAVDTVMNITRSATTVTGVTFPAETISGSNSRFNVGSSEGSVGSLAYFRTTASNITTLRAVSQTATFPTGIFHNQATSGDNQFLVFATESGLTGTTRGSITYNRGGGVVAFNTTCRESLKTNIRLSPSGVELLRQLPIVAFDWRDSTAKLPYFVTFERTQPLFPWACQNDGVDVSKLVPLTIKVVQELLARIETLEAAAGVVKEGVKI